jgi:hypothetical protein
MAKQKIKDESNETAASPELVVVRSSLDFIEHYNFAIEGDYNGVSISLPGLNSADDHELKHFDNHDAVGNLSIMTPEMFALLSDDRIFQARLKAGKVEILDKVPDGYVSSDKRVAEANEKLAQANKETEEAKAAAAAKDKEIAELKAKLQAFGHKD